MKEKLVSYLGMFFGVFVFCCSGHGIAVAQSDDLDAHASIILVLGSKDPEVREARVGLACDLLRKENLHFDKIVLSGGCGAHGTDETNCEASDMVRILKEACTYEIDSVAIYKEENSGSTVQNYCFCRSLEGEGGKVIRAGDTLYVVSNHYHALSVAACFGNDGVDAHYYYTCGDTLYEGAAPSTEEVAGSKASCFKDYTGIAHKCSTSGWCKGQSAWR